VRFDRVAEDIYVFASGLYAQVTATVLLTKQGAIIIDTMPFPIETRQIVSFVASRLGPDRVRYVVYTHHHGDHVYGAYLFRGAETVAHDLCRDTLNRFGRAALEGAKADTLMLAEVELRVPDVTFEREMHIHLAHRHVRLFHTPGHTLDGTSAFVVGEKVLVAGDAMMPVPYIVHGDRDQLRETLLRFRALRPAFVVQGHGEVLLRGELEETIDSHLSYLDAIVDRVEGIVQRGAPPEKLAEIDIESCGKSRVPLDGLVSKLHHDNLVALYEELTEAGRPQTATSAAGQFRR